MKEEKHAIDPRLNEAVHSMWDSLTDEQKAKAKDCKTLDEFLALAGKAGTSLPDELLEAVAGGIPPTPTHMGQGNLFQ